MPDPIVEVRHLRKTYGQTVALEDVSLSVAPGEIFGILGPNGRAHAAGGQAVQVAVT